MDGIDANSIDTGDTSPENTDTDVTSTDAADTEDIADDNDLPNEPHEQDKQNDRNERNILSDIDTHTSEISAEEITPRSKTIPEQRFQCAETPPLRPLGSSPETMVSRQQ